MSTREQARPSVDHLESRLEFETLLADLSSRFINLPSGEVDREIEGSLRRVCELLGIDAAVLWQWTAVAPDTITPTHIYYAQGGFQPPEPMRQEHFPWCRTQMLAGRSVVFSSLEELPAEAAVDRETCRLLGVKSNLCLPLSVGDEPPVGALGLSTLRAQRDWPDALVKRLHLVAQVFTNALARRRRDLSLKENEERLALAADSAEAGLWTLDYSTGVFWATDRARAIFGYSPDEVISIEHFEASVHPDDWDLVRGAIERSARAGEPVNVEYRIILPGDGRVRWITSRGRPHFASTGEPDRLTGVSIDVTESRRAEEALRTSEARRAAGADLAGLAFYDVDFGEGIMYVDDRFHDLCGFPPDRDQGLQALEFWMEHLHPDDRPRVLDLRRQLHDGRLDEVSLDYRYVHPVRGEVWIQHLARVATRDATGRTVRSFGVLREITGRKRAEVELGDLSQRLIRAHEEERALLARELHDDVTQRLAVLAIDLGRAELAVPDGEQAEVMRGVREGLVRLSEDVHSLAYQLHPSVLDELGLVEALQTECERFGRRGGVELSLELDPLPTTLGKDAALCLFRVAQEALNNVFRHAGARAANVTLREMSDGLLLAVRDDGVGFDPQNPGKGGRLGMASMRERVRLVNGTLDVESAPGQGTTIVAWVPLEGRST
jgi:PAS domain S-box-containing protein